MLIDIGMGQPGIRDFALVHFNEIMPLLGIPVLGVESNPKLDKITQPGNEIRDQVSFFDMVDDIVPIRCAPAWPQGIDTGIINVSGFRVDRFRNGEEEGLCFRFFCWYRCIGRVGGVSRIGCGCLSG